MFKVNLNHNLLDSSKHKYSIITFQKMFFLIPTEKCKNFTDRSSRNRLKLSSA